MSVPEIRYRAPARWLHWGVALLVIATIPVGLLMVQDGLDRALRDLLFLFHKNVGVLVFLLVVVRLVYRWRTPPPDLPEDMPALQRLAAGLTHAGLYALLFLMPVLGYVRVKAGGFPIESLDALGMPSLVARSDALAEVAKTAHYLGGIAIAGLIVMHIGAAAYHGIVRRDGVFSRMWPPFGRAER